MQVAKGALNGLAWGLGSSKFLPVYYNSVPAFSSQSERLPVVVFSHGLAGTRNAYSSICTELASQGYVVLAIEHGDGSASTARLPRVPPPPPDTTPPAPPPTVAPPASGALPSTVPADRMAALYAGAAIAGRAIRSGAPPVKPGTTSLTDGADSSSSGSSGSSTDGKGGSGAEGEGGPDAGSSESDWWWYNGLGTTEEQLAKTAHRVSEVRGALQVLAALEAGSLSGLGEVPPAVAAGLRGRLDLSRAAVIGHSYGGATAAAAGSMLDGVKCAISLDPWWDCYEEKWPVLFRWQQPAPLLVIGSHDWNIPDDKGKLKCGENQERVFAAAAAGGGGVVHVVPRGSSHGNFDDVLLLFGAGIRAASCAAQLTGPQQPAAARTGCGSTTRAADASTSTTSSSNTTSNTTSNTSSTSPPRRPDPYDLLLDLHAPTTAGKSLVAVLKAFNFKSTLEPRKAHQINMFCIMHFLSKHLPPAASATATANDDGEEAAAAAASASAGGSGFGRAVEDGDLQAYQQGVGEDCEVLTVRPGAAAAAERVPAGVAATAAAR